MNAIAINDRQQFPKYILGYDTPEAAEAASNLAGGTDFVFVPRNSTEELGGPGTVIKALHLFPEGTTLGPAALSVNGVAFDVLLNTTYVEIPPVTSLNLGIQQTTSENCAIALGAGVSALVTGYFTPTI